MNEYLPIASEAPHGGVKDSGFGKDMSRESLLEYTVTGPIMVKRAQLVVHDSFRLTERHLAPVGVLRL